MFNASFGAASVAMFGCTISTLSTRSPRDAMAWCTSVAKVCLVALTLSAVATDASAQQPLPDPSLLLVRNALTRGVARQADGKLLVLGGGATDFRFISGGPSPTFSASAFKEGLLRLNADGSLDTSFNVVVDEDSNGNTGNIFDIKLFGNFAYVVGDFQSIGGVRRNGLARINIVTNAVDAAWNPNPVGRVAGQLAVGSIAIDGGGNLYTFGSLYDIGGKLNVRMAKIPASSVNGAADPAFDGRQVTVNLTQDIVANGMAVSANGAVYVFGRRPNPTGSQNTRIYKINPLTGLQDTTWLPDLTAIDMFVNQVIADASGDIYVSGQATGTATIGANLTSPYNLVKLSGANGQVAPGWVGGLNPPGVPPGSAPNYSIRQHAGLSHDGAGSLYAFAGRFFSDFTELLPVKYNANTGLPDPAFFGRNVTGSFSNSGYITATPEGVYIEGPGYYGGVRTGSVLKLDRATGALLPGFSVNLKNQGIVSTSTRLADGSVLMAGAFQEANGVALNNIIRFNADGTFDPTFTNGPGGSVISIKDILGKLYVSGGFNFSGTSAREHLARYDSVSGVLDPNWAPVIDGNARAFAGDANNIYMVGGIYTVNGVVTNCLAKVSSATGQVDTSWRPLLANVSYGSLCQRSIAKVGNFVYVGFPNNQNFGGPPRIVVNGQNRTLARIDAATGQVDNAWDPAPSNATGAASPVSALEYDGSNLYVSGSFSRIAGVNTRLAKIAGATGAIDASFVQQLTGIPNNPTWIRSAPSGVFLVGSDFDTANTNRVRVFVWKIRPDATRDTAWAPSFEYSDQENAFNSAVEPLGASRVMVGQAFGPKGDVFPVTVGGNQAYRLPGGLSIAAFSVVAPTTLNLGINGRGTVDVSSNGGTPNVQCFDCKGGPFSYEFDTAATVTLTARPAPGWMFVGWQGNNGAASCTSSGPCVLTLNTSTNVSASFRNVANLIEQ